MGNVITVKWNQMAPALNDDNYISYLDTATSVTYDNGVATQTWLKSGAGFTYTTKTREYLSWQEGHIYYVSYMLYPDFDCAFSIEWCVGQIPNGVLVHANEWSRLSFMTTATTTNAKPIYLPDARTSGSSANSTCQFKAPIVIDFTLMYGAGNEPATIEEFERQCYMNNISLTEFLPQNTAGTNQEWRIAYDKKSYIVSGDIASFRSAARVPIESLKCHFLPKQNLHGYNSPWPAGGGKNLFDESTIIYGTWTAANGTVRTANPGCRTVDIAVTSGEIYTAMYKGKQPYSGSLIELDENKNFILRTHCAWQGTSTPTVLSVTLNENTKYIYLQVYHADAGDAQITPEVLATYKMQLEKGNTSTSYEPYENICPIEGWNNIEITHTGKNMIDASIFADPNYNITYSNGILTGTADNLFQKSCQSGKLITNFKGKLRSTFSLSACTDGNQTTSGDGLQPFFHYSSGNKTLYTYSNATQTYLKKSLSLYNYNQTVVPEFFSFSYWGAPNNIWHIKELQWEMGDSASDYEPYKGQIYNINWSNDAGTIYGGYVDIIKGELVAEYKLLTITGDESNLSINWDALLIPVPDSVSDNESQIVIACSHTNNCIHGTDVWSTSRGKNPNANTNNICVAGSSGSQLRFRKRDLDPNYTRDIELYKIWLRQQNTNGTPLQIVYKLTIPVIYQLTSQQLKTFLNYNNIWSNTNDITEVSYYVNDSNMIRNIRTAMMTHTHELPPAYQRCDYLQTVGTASYIDTGVMGNDDTIKIDFIIEVLSKGNYSGIMGNHDGEDKKCWRFIQSASTVNNGFNFTLNNRRAGASPRLSIDTVSSIVGLPIIVHMEYNLGTLTYQNITYSTSTTTDTSEASNENIFIGRNGPASTTSATAPNNRFHKYIKIYKSGFLIRNYVPCYRKSDNKAGFYDLINHTFNPSIGSAEFTAGYNT